MREIRTPWKATPHSRRRWQKLLVVVVGLGAGMAASSELPDRECCDSAPPPPPHYLTVTSTSSSSTSQPPTHGGANVSQEKEPLNCLLAKSLCDQDAKCSAILKVVPILCGPELVVCSTVTVSRCQAALRTLVFFPWFDPTCLCKEPRLDPLCNAFRDLLFDHPCNRKEVDIDLLPHIAACGRAADLCRDDLWCKPRLEQFRAACRFRDGHCRTRDRARCVEAWQQVRDTPLLGCICLEDSDRKCSRLYALVNHNPCVGDSYPSRVASMSGVSQALSTPLTRPVPVPTAAASLLVASASHSDPLYPLSTIHHYLQHLPEDKTDEDLSLVQVRRIVGTCHVALTDCQADDGCSSHLKAVTGHCASYCHQDACRSAIQDLYKHLKEANMELALKMALCVCRREGAGEASPCARAQELMHPQCAQRTDTLPVTQCHHLGQDCRTHRLCRYQLEQYEVGCAADLLTGMCAGSAHRCSLSAMGLLGTRLHTDCECKSDAGVQEVNQCLAWRRLLWGNPCVVEAQLSYHLKVEEEEDVVEAESSTSPDEVWRESGVGESDEWVTQRVPHLPDGGSYDTDFDSTSAVELIDLDGTLVQARQEASTPRSAPSTLQPPTTTATTTTTTTTSTTTTSLTTSLPDRYCEVRRRWEARPRIIEEHESIRLYTDGEKDCSELCLCERHLQAKCEVLECVENLPCETDYAVYNHKAPAYQAYRGECMCYSGDFICMRPRVEEYQLPTGLFLLVGFSRTEEDLLRAVTRGGAVDALIPLQRIVSTISSDMGEECRLELFQHTTDNLVLQVRHYQISSGVGNHNYTLYMFQEERTRCEKPVRLVAQMINRRDPKIHHDVRLSLYVLAEVVDTVPNPKQPGSGRPSPLAAGVWACWWAWPVALVVLGLQGSSDEVSETLDAVFGFWSRS